MTLNKLFDDILFEDETKTIAIEGLCVFCGRVKDLCEVNAPLPIEASVLAYLHETQKKDNGAFI